MSGFLSEKGKNFFKPWQKRYCVIDGATLTVRHKNILGIVCPPSLILQYVFCPAHTLQIFMDDKKEVQMSYINLKDIKLVEVKKNLINISLAVGKKELKTTTDESGPMGGRFARRVSGFVYTRLLGAVLLASLLTQVRLLLRMRPWNTDRIDTCGKAKATQDARRQAPAYQPWLLHDQLGARTSALSPRSKKQPLLLHVTHKMSEMHTQPLFCL